MKDLIIKPVGSVPISLYFIEELGIAQLLDSYLPQGKAELPHGKVLTVLLLNILNSSTPLYKIKDWLSDYSDGIGEYASQADKYHDKRLGDSLDILYKSDRHSLLAAISSNSIKIHKLSTDSIHNDTTKITFCSSEPKGLIDKGKDKKGNNAYQVLWGLNVCADGFVPISYQIYSGRDADSTTHPANWKYLQEFLKGEPITYIADCKVSTTENIQMITESGGKLISILPANRKEVKKFHEKESNPKNWILTYKSNSGQNYRLKEEGTTKEGLRMIWVYSYNKAKQERDKREKFLQKDLEKLKVLSEKKINHYRLKSKESIEKHITKHIKNKENLIDIQVIENQNDNGKKTCSITYQVSQEKIDLARRKDGLFPLITNKKDSPVSILEQYKNQPFLENRFRALKSTLEVAPMFLEKPERIEAMLFLYFIALMIIALIERKIRLAMKETKVEKIPILPQNKKTATPTWAAIRYCFHKITSVEFDTEQSIFKGIKDIHLVVLKLLNIPLDFFKQKMEWWSWEIEIKTSG